MTLDLLFPHFETLIRTPEDVARLNEAILALAVQGQLVPQDPADEPASELLKRIRADKRRLVKEKGSSDSQRLPPISQDEIPYDLPRGWQWVRLPEVYHTWGQKTPDERFTYIDVSSINNAQGVIKNDLTIIDPQDAPSRARKIVRQGTVIYSTVRPYLLNIAIVDQDFEFPPIASTAFAVMHPFEGVLAKYLFYYLRSRPFIDFVESQMTGMAYPAINDSKLNLGLLPLPPLAEQRRIVAKVESLFAQTRALEAKLRQAQDDIVTINRAALGRLSAAADGDAFAAAWRTVADAFDLLYDDPRTVAELRQAILQLAVQGKLVPQDPSDEPASELLKRIRAERRRLVKEGKLREEKPLPLPGATEVPFSLPQSWQWVRLGHIANHRLGKMLDQHKNRGVFRPYVRNLNIQWKRVDLSDIQEMRFEEEELDEYQLMKGDLLICEGGEPGRCAIWDYSDRQMMFQKAIHRVRPLAGIASEYLLYHLWADANNKRLEAFFTGATIKHFTGKALANYVCALPPLAEQRRIVAKVDQLMRQCDALEAGLARAEGARRALAAAVLGGAAGGDASLGPRRSAP